MSETTSTENEGTSTATASEGSSASAGASTEGAGAGSSSSAGGDFAAERTRLEAQVRQFQSQTDRLTRELADLKAAGEAAPTNQPQGLTLEQMRTELRRTQEMTIALPTLREQFPDADPALFTDLDSYESAQALRAAAEASHTSIQTRATAAAERLSNEKLAAYRAKYGELELAPAGGEQGGGTGDPTSQQVAAMSFAERDALEAKSPGVIKRVIESATTTV